MYKNTSEVGKNNFSTKTAVTAAMLVKERAT
jgi:hypothetical protein